MSDFNLPRLNERVESQPLPPSEVLVPPVAAFSSAVAGSSVQFTDLSTSPSGHQIVAWNWDFGDTAAAPPPTANFTFQINGLAVQFTDTSTAVSPKTIASRLWNFGDGTTSTAANPSKTYAAAGNYNVTLTVTDSGSVVSPTKQKTVSLQAAGGLGRLFSCYSFWDTTTAPNPNTAPFNASFDGITANNIIGRINAARSRGHHLIFNMQGGDHSQYITNGKFDPAKWRSRTKTFDTPAIRQAIADAVSDRTVVGNSMIDESQHPSWGGAATKAVMDACADYARNIFPTLPEGVTELGDEGGYAGTFHSVDFTVHSYLWRRPDSDNGNVDLWRSMILSENAQQGVQTLWIVNPLNGGRRAPEDPSAAGCPLPLTGGQGTFNVNCRMTAAQVQSYGLALAPYGAGVAIWKYDASQMAATAYKNAFNAIAADLAGRPVVSLVRP